MAVNCSSNNPLIKAFSPEEIKAIGELKELLPEIIKESGIPENYTLWGVPFNKESTDERLDIILVKFLRAR